MLRWRLAISGLVLGWLLVLSSSAAIAQPAIQEYPVPVGSHPHDVAPAVDGGVWYTAQARGMLGWLDPNTGGVREVPLGPGSAPHGVIVGPDGAPWITDGGQNAILRVDPISSEVRTFPLPISRNANLNTATFDSSGTLWFTGQAGVYGRMDAGTGQVEAFDAPRGAGPYGIIATPDGRRVFYASLAGSHIAEINLETGQATPIDSPTPGQGARRVWTDSSGLVWVSEWNAGQLGRYDPRTGEWREWPLPGARPAAYAVYVDDQDAVWVSDFGANSVLRFDPVSESFTPFSFAQRADVRQLLGRPGEVWGAESAADRLFVIRR